MKNKDYIKKYRLDAVTIFPHGQFAIDWGNDFLSRIEVWREFGSWNENTFWRLYEEMRKKWESLDLKFSLARGSGVSSVVLVGTPIETDILALSGFSVTITADTTNGVPQIAVQYSSYTSGTIVVMGTCLITKLTTG